MGGEASLVLEFLTSPFCADSPATDVDLSEMAEVERRMRELDNLRTFGEACRRDLDSLAHLPQGSYAGIGEEELANQ